MKDGKAREGIAQRLSALCFEMEAAGIKVSFNRRR